MLAWCSLGALVIVMLVSCTTQLNVGVLAIAFAWIVGVFIAGLTPREALASATLTGPKFLGHADRYGAVAKGKAADILILDANPLQDISATRKIRSVVAKGKLFDRAALDGLLETARSKAARAE